LKWEKIVGGKSFNNVFSGLVTLSVSKIHSINKERTLLSKRDLGAAAPARVPWTGSDIQQRR